MKNIKLLIISILTIIIAFGCNDSESDLLKSKIYFENKQIKVEVEDVETYDVEILSRVSNLLDHDINVEYQIGDESYVETYNKKHGTSFMYMPTANYVLETSSSVIKQGATYAEPCKLSLKNLSVVEEGNTYIIPIILKSDGLPSLDDSNISYIVIKKPIVINKVYDFNGKWLDIQLPKSAQKTTSVTYEALIYPDRHVSLSTIMGNEGILIFRFGDNTIKDNEIQIAGNVQFHSTTEFKTGQWYHVAFTYDAPSEMATIYMNGEKIAEKVAGAIEFDLNKRFCIGYAYDYDANRIWRGKMSECRLWTVARTANELRENMMSVDPNSNGLLGYWKLNGTDYENRDGKYYVKDQTKNGLDALSKRGKRGENGNTPGPSVEPSVVDLKVKLN